VGTGNLALGSLSGPWESNPVSPLSERGRLPSSSILWNPIYLDCLGNHNNEYRVAALPLRRTRAFRP
jgi:hypothetical protein